MSDYAENAIDALIAHHPSPGEQFYPAFEATPELDAAASGSAFPYTYRKTCIDYGCSRPSPV